ncbi:hypothetical protein [Streptomyces chartreusis]
MNLRTSQGDEGPRLLVLFVAAVAVVLSARNQAWASALGGAAAVYTVLATGDQDRRS